VVVNVLQQLVSTTVGGTLLPPADVGNEFFDFVI
jgi:hypothetical protein